MNKLASPKIVALAFGVLVVSFAVGFYVFAWQEPTEAPPEGNVPTPLNVGLDHQTKEGDLTIGIAEIHGDGSMGPELNADKLDDYHAADLMAGVGGGFISYYTIEATPTVYTGNLGGYEGYFNKCVSAFGEGSIPFSSLLLYNSLHGGAPLVLKWGVTETAWWQGLALNWDPGAFGGTPELPYIPVFPLSWNFSHPRIEDFPSPNCKGWTTDQNYTYGSAIYVGSGDAVIFGNCMIESPLLCAVPH